MDLSFSDIRKLAELLKPEQESSDSEDDLPKTGLARFGPGHIGSTSGTKKSNAKKPEGNDNNENKDDKDGGDFKSIWEDEEIPEGIIYDESEDPREKPEYDLKYKQAVSTEEMFLQMGQKNPSTASCEEIVVEIKLPNENQKKVDLNVLKQVLELRSPKYRLSLPLPHPVHTDSAKAVWDSEKLTITLRMDREFDYINL